VATIGFSDKIAHKGQDKAPTGIINCVTLCCLNKNKWKWSTMDASTEVA